jgi:micrococcal nuclease
MRRTLACLLFLGVAGCGPRSQLDDDAGEPNDPLDAGGRLDASGMPTGNVLVRTVLDGDTVILGAGASVRTPDGRPLDGERVRLLGIDSPEVAHEGSPADCYGDEAATFTRDNIGNRIVTIEFDETHCRPPRDTVGCRDEYGRLLAYVRIQDKVWNEDLLRTGNARVFRGERFRHRDSDKYLALESEARRRRLGMWSCP